MNQLAAVVRSLGVCFTRFVLCCWCIDTHGLKVANVYESEQLLKS
jgi:hypothetical protein